MNVLRLLRRHHVCRHPPGCTVDVGPDELMCDLHGDTLSPVDGDTLAPVEVNRRRNVWPTRKGNRRG